MNIFTKSNLRKEIFTKSLAVKSCSNLNRTTKYRLSEGNGHVSKSAMDKLKYGHRTTHTASDRTFPKRQYDTNPCILVYSLMLSPVGHG